MRRTKYSVSIRRPCAASTIVEGCGSLQGCCDVILLAALGPGGLQANAHCAIGRAKQDVCNTGTSTQLYETPWPDDQGLHHRFHAGTCTRQRPPYMDTVIQGGSSGCSPRPSCYCSTDSEPFTPASSAWHSLHLIDADHVVLPTRCQAALLAAAAAILLVYSVLLCARPAKPPDRCAMRHVARSCPHRFRSC